jgi:peptide methionine sulfoxide reductase MsrA
VTLLKAFFKAHDPTQLNRQNDEDVGTMYRSAIFYHDEEQKAAAQQMIDGLNAEVFDGKVVTTLEEMTKFWPAEDYHQDYYANNPTQDYCYRIVRKKFKKFLKNFEYLKEDEAKQALENLEVQEAEQEAKKLEEPGESN